MERQLSGKIKIVEQGDNSDIVYVAPDGANQVLRFNEQGVYLNSTASILTTAMPVSYSSAFQTATLASTFVQIASPLLAFANIVNYSFTSTVNGVSTTIAIKTS
jgi:hypothetical protein